MDISLNTRNDYTKGYIDEKVLNNKPIDLFQRWIKEVESMQIPDYNAMILSTTDHLLQSHSRVVLLREILDDGLQFYTNYLSNKGKEIQGSNRVSLLFYWAGLQRQVRIEGRIKKSSKTASDKYFETRPRASQISAWASDQSQALISNEAFKQKLNEIETKYKNKRIPRPDFWGGYIVTPELWEFWQGQPARLNQRFLYEINGKSWKISQLQP